MGSTSWFRPDRVRDVVVADATVWRGRLRALLLGPVQEEAAQSVVFGMGLLIFVDLEAMALAQDAASEQIKAALPRQRAASD